MDSKGEDERLPSDTGMDAKAAEVAEQEAVVVEMDPQDPPSRKRKASLGVGVEKLSPHLVPVIEQHDGQGGTWQLDAKSFEAAKVDVESPRVKNANKPDQLRNYYERQNAMIETFVALHSKGEDQGGEEEDGEESGHVYFALMLSFSFNVLLTAIKLVAVILTGSMAVIASFIDSCLDLVSGGILYWTAVKMAQHNTFKYPQGKARLEPIGTVIFASVMGLSSLQILAECVKRLIRGIDGNPDDIEMGMVAIIILSVTIVVKAGLWVYCQWVTDQFSSVSVDACAQDHINDIVTNIIAAAGAILAAEIPQVWWLDSSAAAVIAIVIIYAWGLTAKEQIDMLTGRAASPQFLRKVTYMVYNHDEAILKVDTVRAYHFGVNFLVEVDIVLPPDMPLRLTHDIGESLQIKLEELEDVERAFVHIDWEWEHSPSIEHR